MEKTLALNNFWFQNSAKNNFRFSTKAVSPNVRYLLALSLLAANILLLGSYIYGVNKFATKGYEIKKIQTQLAALSEDNKKINLRVSEANSMVGIQNDFLNSNFVAAGTPKFLEVNQQAKQYGFVSPAGR